MAASIQQQILNEVMILRKDVSAIAQRQEKTEEALTTITTTVSKHDGLLYRSNGDPGLRERVEELEEIESQRVEETLKVQKSREQSTADIRKTGYGMIAALLMLIIDIALHIFRISH